MLPNGNMAQRRTRGAKPFLSSLLLAIGLLAAGIAMSSAQSGPAGITDPVAFPPFNPSAPSCSKPLGLNKILAFAQDNQRDFMQGVASGLAKAARDRGLEYRLALANNDSVKQAEQLRQLLGAKIGGLVASPVNSVSLSRSLQEVIWTGSYVGTVVPPPATSLLNAPQYQTGKVLGAAAASHIKERLGGKAKVVLLTQDNIEFLAPRFVAIRDALKDIAGVTIIADISPTPVNKEGGQATMNTVLLAYPDVDVVLGADTVVLGALAALRAAGKDRPDQFLGGIDGEAEAVAEIKTGGTPFKVSISLASPIFGYAMGQHAADWLEGKSIPQAMDILPRPLTNASIKQYEADLADPATVYADPARRDVYLKMYGNICYDTRDRYVNFPWSSESR